MFRAIGDRLLIGGDFNAKNPMWGSRILSSKERELNTGVRLFRYFFNFVDVVQTKLNLL